MRTVIIEPHGDDALISCWPLFHHNDFLEHVLEVWTVATSRSSEGLMKHFPGKVTSTDYGDCWDLKPEIAKCVNYKLYLAWKKTWNNVQDGLLPEPWWWSVGVQREYARDYWLECWDLAVEWLHGKLKTLRSGDCVFAPIGIIHPQHILVASLCYQFSKEFPNLNWCYYLDAPYNAAKWTRELWMTHPGLWLKLVQVYGPDQPDFKERVFRDVYPSEIKIFRFTYRSVIHNDYSLVVPNSNMMEDILQ